MIAALAPFVTGWVREHTGGFALAWAYLGAVVLVLLPLLLRFDPRRYGAATAELFAPRAVPSSSLAPEGAATRKV